MLYKTPKIEADFNDGIDIRLRGALLETEWWLKTTYNKSLTLTCLGRSLSENVEVGGAKDSAHLTLQGADIRVWEFDALLRRAIIERLSKYPFLYASFHKDHIHCSIRKKDRLPKII